MRLLHTADWHLGHGLHDHPRTHEHRAFLAWLLGVLARERVDALLIAGDVFDVANPPTAALWDWYGFLAQAQAARPGLQIVVVGGNHDSPARLDVTNALLPSAVRVVGGLPRRPDGTPDLDRLLVPLGGDPERPDAWCLAVPFLRPSDLPTVDGAGKDPLIEGVRALYRDVVEAAKARRSNGQPIIAMGHCYMTGTALSELSERRILGGNQHALPVDLFADDLAYVALGHLHLAQTVGGHEHVRYSGSPIPLSFAEIGYRHQVSLVDLDGTGPARVTSIPVPRAVEVLRVPTDRARPLEEVLPALRALADHTGALDDPTRPLLEVRVLCDKPQPRLRQEIEAAAEGKRPRLLRIALEAAGNGQALGDGRVRHTLRDVTPLDVFRKRYEQAHGGEPTPELVAAFSDLLDEVERRDGVA
jgi:exonuclease SbcD